MKKCTNFRAEDLWKIYGNFGYVNGLVENNDVFISNSNGEYIVRSQYIEDEQGVFLRKGNIKNISSRTFIVNCLMSKFVFDGGEYEVYTQRNSWQNESDGRWQPLITSVSAESEGLRNAYGAAPFFAIWNQQTSRGVAFHIMTRLPWQFVVKNVPTGGESNNLEIEIGVNSCNFSAKISSGEELVLPDILFYEIRNKLGMDCYKLHQYMHNTYPRREMPVVYNTWLYKFEKIDFENVYSQIRRAKELGVEYFVIDAAWYGQGEMWGCRGDWYENQENVFRGRMSELSEAVKENGMKFGFWLEVETAGREAKVLENHRNYYFTYIHNGNELYFFDFSKNEACEYLFKTVSNLIEMYGAEYIKFDFNQDVKLDTNQNAFMDYFEGYNAFIQKIKAVYPDLYIQNCASGGLRMTLVNGMDFDSFWLSDNQSVHEGIRIVKDTIRRMPPQMIDRWATIQSVCDFKHAYGNNPLEKLVSTNDGTWNDIRGVHQSYLEGFLTGGPIGFSCDLNSLSESVITNLKRFIVKFKAEREFWKKAVCRILVDTKSILVLEYSDIKFEKIEIIVYADRIRQRNIVIYPTLDMNADYCIDINTIIHGKQIDAEGIDVVLNENYTAKRISLHKVEKL